MDTDNIETARVGSGWRADARGPERGTFPGQNFLTPNWVGYFHGYVNGTRAWAELSAGDGIDGHTIYGLTIRRPGGARFEPEPSRCCHSRAEVAAVLGIELAAVPRWSYER
jgi:hypothetical protein